MTETAAKRPAKKAATKGRPIEDVNLPPEVDGINELQMRRLHGLFRSRLGMTERDDQMEYLVTALNRPLSHKTEVTRSEADDLIQHLTNLPPAPATDEEWAALARPFAEEAHGKLPRSTCRACSQAPRKVCEQHQWIRCNECGQGHSNATFHLTYIGHADVTQRLNEVDPYWSWEPMARDTNGMPVLDGNGGLWMNLTVLGVTRPGYGDCSGGQQTGGDRIKVAIGDALRNAAMRFGVALDLWTKGDREWAHTTRDTEPMTAPPPPEQREATAEAGPTKGESLLRLDDLAEQIGMNREQITAKWRQAHGDMEVANLVHVPAPVLADLAESIAAYVETMRKQA